MAFNPTAMQQRAIDTNGNILVAAAAGSGKTAVLVERVISKILNKETPVDADKFLIVTFTNAAAAEMRGRIEARLYDECQKHPEDAHLLRQRHLIAGADICTIDSFCINLVRQNFELCGVEPDFKIADSISEKSAVDAAVNKVFEENFDLQNTRVLKLLSLAGCEYTGAELKELIIDIYNYSQYLPFSDIFIENLKVPYEMPFGSSHPWYKGGIELAKDSLGQMLLSLEKMADNALLMENTATADKCDAYVKSLSQITHSFSEVLSGEDWDSISLFFKEYAFAKSPSSSTTDPAALSYKAAYGAFGEEYKRLLSIFSLNTEEMNASLSENRGAVRLLVKMLREYSAELKEIFKRENFYTFSQIEQIAFSLLCEPKESGITLKPYASEIIERYDEVMVDEFQDVNDLQNLLFAILSDNERKLFAVGDVKQSIYGFRGSNPENFLNKKLSYVPVADALDTDAKKIILSDNFRSRKGVCEYVNFFFRLCMSGECGRLIYDDEEKLNPAREFPALSESDVELLVLDKSEGNIGVSAIEYEARAIAEYIKETMQKAPFLSDKDGNLRSADYGDFVILLDRMKDKANVIAKVLSSHGIPVAAVAENYNESYEIVLMLSLLQIIDNPKSEVELLSVMMSPLFGFTAEEMAQIRISSRKSDLHSAVLMAASSGNNKAQNFIEQLFEMRKMAAVMPISELIMTLISKTDILNIVSAMPSGELRRSNLLSLSKYADIYSASRSGSASSFARYIRELPAVNFKEAALGGERSVRIMTMHGSKGLQFPICIVANLSGKINRDDAIARVLYKSENGIVFKSYDEQSDDYKRSLGYIAAAEKAYESIIDERLRLLYVAMTRAEERLVLVSLSDNLESKLLKVCENLKDNSVSGRWLKSTTAVNDWILATALLHPDCESLRKICGFSYKSAKNCGEIKLRIIDCAKLSDKFEIESDKEITADATLADQIKGNIGYSYPYAELKSVKAKASVSILAHSNSEKDYDFSDKPAFMYKEGISPAGRGTATHHIMQFINMQQRVDVAAEIERLLEWQYISPAEAQVCDISAIERFFDSDLYRRIMASPDVRREMRFMSEVAADRIYDGLKSEAKNENVVIQGAVDLCFVEDDKVVVLDFKTDRVQNEKQLIDSYSQQLSIYADACRKIFGKEVKEKIIYSFALDREIKLG